MYDGIKGSKKSISRETDLYWLNLTFLKLIGHKTPKMIGNIYVLCFKTVLSTFQALSDSFSKQPYG